MFFATVKVEPPSPILTSALAPSAFALLICGTKVPDAASAVGFKGMGSLGAAAGLLFAVILAQINLRQKVVTSEVIYLEYFYFVAYLAIIAVASNAILFSVTSSIKFIEYRDNLLRIIKGKMKGKEATGTPPEPPAISARAKLVEAALQEGNVAFFNKSIANRMWHRFLGYGLVAPLDQMHSENKPSHPELLEWLARDTSAHQYDLRRLIRGIVLSAAYARSSKYPSADEPNPK